jgi:hypothetical protein
LRTAIQVVFDCADPDRLAKFWAEVLHYKKQDPPPGFATWEDFLKEQGVPEEAWNSRSAIVDPEGKGSRIFFQQVPEPKTVKNRVHRDGDAGGGRQTPEEQRKRRIWAEVQRLTGLGAKQLRVGEELGSYWIVMADPEGNEFCLH